MYPEQAYSQQNYLLSWLLDGEMGLPGWQLAFGAKEAKAMAQQLKRQPKAVQFLPKKG